MNVRSLARNEAVQRIAASVLLAVMLFLANHIYLTRKWPKDLFTTNSGHPVALALVILLVGCVGMLVPKRQDTPGGVVVIFLFAFVYIPTVSITLGQSGWISYLPEVFALSAGFSIAAVTALRTSFAPAANPVLPVSLLYGLLLVWALTTWLLIAEYGDTMSIVGIKDTYTQREAGRATTVLMAYVQTYYLTVFCPGLLAFALVRRKWWWAGVLAAIGFVIIYSITAQKMAVIIPMLMVGFAILSRVAFLRGTVVLLAAISAAVLVGIIHYQFFVGSNSLIASIIIHRTFGIPAMTLHWYYEVFSESGYTLWSHVRGISSFISPPDNLAQDPLWPNLGFIIGDRVLGNPINNVNANLFSSDGAAGGGLLGILIISMALSVWVAVLNFAARRWDATLAVLVIIPVAITLTNGPLFTVLLSFGGLFWTLTFAIFAQLQGRRLAAA